MQSRVVKIFRGETPCHLAHPDIRCTGGRYWIESAIPSASHLDALRVFNKGGLDLPSVLRFAISSNCALRRGDFDRGGARFPNTVPEVNGGKTSNELSQTYLYETAETASVRSCFGS